MKLVQKDLGGRWFLYHAALRAAFTRSSACFAPSLPRSPRRAFHHPLSLIIFSVSWSHIIDKYTFCHTFVWNYKNSKVYPQFVSFYSFSIPFRCPLMQKRTCFYKPYETPYPRYICKKERLSFRKPLPRGDSSAFLLYAVFALFKS